VGKGVRTSPRDALLSKSCAENERGIAFGFQRAMDHAGAIIGPLIATILLATVTTNIRMVFLLAVLPSLATIWILLRGVTEVKENGPAASSASPPKLQWKGWSRKFKSFLVIITLFTIGNSSDAFLLLRAKDLGVDSVSIPILWVALHVSKMIFSVPGGSLSDRIEGEAS
jgi:MFS family permease